MSKIKLPYSQAASLAERIKAALAPGCSRIEVAGSIRRKKATIGDIEIVCIPRMMTDLFGVEMLDPYGLDYILAELVEAGRLGEPLKNGPAYKQFPVPAVDGLNLDLFITKPDQWGIILAIRTGSADFSRRLVTQRNKGGLLPSDCVVSGGAIRRGAEIIPTPEETDVFELVGGWVEPEARV